MKKVVYLIVVCMFGPLLWAQPLDRQVERAVTKAVITQPVSVQVKLVKPVYSSDVMFRRPRKNVIISTKQKENTCTGFWKVNGSKVYIPAVCAQEEGYHITAVKLVFADGHTSKLPGKQVQIRGDVALISL